MDRLSKTEKKRRIHEILKNNIHDSGPLEMFIPADEHFPYNRIFIERFKDERGRVFGRYAYFEEI